MSKKLTDDSVALFLGMGGLGLTAFTIVFTSVGNLDPQIAITGISTGSTALGGAFGLAKGSAHSSDDDKATPPPAQASAPPPTPPIAPVEPVPSLGSFDGGIDPPELFGFAAALYDAPPKPRFSHGCRDGCWAKGVDLKG